VGSENRAIRRARIKAERKAAAKAIKKPEPEKPEPPQKGWLPWHDTLRNVLSLGAMVIANVIFVAVWVVAVFLIAVSPNWSRRMKVSATATLTIILIVLDAIAIYRHQDAGPEEIASAVLRITSYQKATDTSMGGSVQITPVGAQLYPNGRFQYPIAIRSNGDGAILNYNYHFRQLLSNRLLTIAEEHKEFEESTKEFFADAQKAKQQKITDIISLLNRNDTAALAQPKIDYDRATVDKVSQGQQFIYNFVVVRYTDKESIKNSKYYIAEYCGRETGRGSFVECGFHNFMKHAEE